MGRDYTSVEMTHFYGENGAVIEEGSADDPRTSQRSPIFRVVCAWCQTVLVEGDPGAATSHGICDSCAKEFDTPTNTENPTMTEHLTVAQYVTEARIMWRVARELRAKGGTPIAAADRERQAREYLRLARLVKNWCDECGDQYVPRKRVESRKAELHAMCVGCAIEKNLPLTQDEESDLGEQRNEDKQGDAWSGGFAANH